VATGQQEQTTQVLGLPTEAAVVVVQETTRTHQALYLVPEVLGL
jgi:hypothetical protein